jgi:hypothetical protein
MRYYDVILWYWDTVILRYCNTEIMWYSEHRTLLTHQHSGKSEKPWTAASQMWERQISVYHIPDCSHKFWRQSTTYRICDATTNVGLGKLNVQTAVVTLHLCQARGRNRVHELQAKFGITKPANSHFVSECKTDDRYLSQSVQPEGFWLDGPQFWSP